MSCLDECIFDKGAAGFFGFRHGKIGLWFYPPVRPEYLLEFLNLAGVMAGNNEQGRCFNDHKSFLAPQLHFHGVLINGVGALGLKLKFEESIFAVQKFEGHNVIGGATLPNFFDA